MAVISVTAIHPIAVAEDSGELLGGLLTPLANRETAAKPNKTAADTACRFWRLGPTGLEAASRFSSESASELGTERGTPMKYRTAQSRAGTAMPATPDHRGPPAMNHAVAPMPLKRRRRSGRGISVRRSFARLCAGLRPFRSWSLYRAQIATTTARKCRSPAVTNSHLKAWLSVAVRAMP